MRLEDGERDRAKASSGLQAGDEALRPCIEHCAFLSAHQHGDDLRFERASIAIAPVPKQRVRQPPKPQNAVRPTPHKSEQIGQQRIAPGQRAVQIEQRYPRGRGKGLCGFLRQLISFQYNALL